MRITFLNKTIDGVSKIFFLFTFFYFSKKETKTNQETANNKRKSFFDEICVCFFGNKISNEKRAGVFL